MTKPTHTGAGVALLERVAQSAAQALELGQRPSFADDPPATLIWAIAQAVEHDTEVGRALVAMLHGRLTSLSVRRARLVGLVQIHAPFVEQGEPHQHSLFAMKDAPGEAVRAFAADASEIDPLFAALPIEWTREQFAAFVSGKIEAPRLAARMSLRVGAFGDGADPHTSEVKITKTYRAALAEVKKLSL